MYRPSPLVRTAFAALILLTSVPVARALAQSATATLVGTVVDEQGAVIRDAEVTISDRARGLERQAATNGNGYFVVSQLPPSAYTVSVRGSGFTTVEIANVVLNVGDQRQLSIRLPVAPVGDAVTVTDSRELDASPAQATVIDRQFVENLPLNGRSFQTLVELAPGVVLAPSNLPNPGQFSVNGQRTGSNYFTVDGVSANFGSTASVTPYETAGGGVPSYSALGSTSSLVSVDALQEFSIQTSTYAPEFGRQPGAQVSLVTRSGTNVVHGSAFDYVRNDIFDANNFFANANRLERPAIRQNDFGFTLGGPVVVPKVYDGRVGTFFFVSYEGLRLRQPVVTSPLEVPSIEARRRATGVTADLLNAFPLPTGPAFADDPDVAPYIGSFSNPSSLDATSVRVDHVVSDRLSVFGRFNYAPSEDRQRARFAAASSVALLAFTTKTLTLGSTMILSPSIVNDLRFNYSTSRVNQSYYLDDFGGAIVPPDSSLYPSFTTGENGYIYIEVDEAGDNTLSDGLFSDNLQRQYNVVDTLSLTAGTHAIKLGADYRRLTPVTNSGNYKRSFLPDSVSALVNDEPAFSTIVAPQFVLRPIYQNTSVFGQDTWRASDRLTLTYGLRYEVNPAPDEANGNLPPTVTGFENGATPVLAPAGTRLYDTTYGNFAPRVGAAFDLFPSRGTVVRGGFGVFYDLGYAFSGNAFSTGNYPFASTIALDAVRYTDPAFAAIPQPRGVVAPYTRLFAYEDGYSLPYTLEYSVAVEHPLTPHDVVTVSYVGAAGRRLGRLSSSRNIDADFRRIDLVTNDGRSDYNALQAQYRRRLSHGLQVLASYTYAKSLDTVSEESINNFQAPLGELDPDLDRGPSSFDVRHAFTSALSYEVPSPYADGVGRAILGGFGADAVVRARTATPVNVLTGRDPFGLGLTTISRPDVVPGVPLYIEDDALPGGRRFNPAAFDGAAPLAQERQGTLGRNVLRGFGASQFDVSLRRQFALTERVGLQVRADGFNVLNHANFANPNGILPSSNFGRATQILGTGLGGLSPIYQIGGPRSFQLSLKLLF